MENTHKIKLNQQNHITLFLTKEEGFIPPYRVGKRQKRAILDANGREVGVFKTGSEKQAQDYCNYLNSKEESWNDIFDGKGFRMSAGDLMSKLKQDFYPPKRK